VRNSPARPPTPPPPPLGRLGQRVSPVKLKTLKHVLRALAFTLICTPQPHQGGFLYECLYEYELEIWIIEHSFGEKFAF
jgi:hypothetical protein